MSAPSNRTVPASAYSKPATMRSKVVFPDPDGPSKAISFPSGMSRSTPASASKVPKALLMPRRLMLMAGPPLDGGLNDERREREQRQKRRDREGRHVLIVVV